MGLSPLRLGNCQTWTAATEFVPTRPGTLCVRPFVLVPLATRPYAMVQHREQKTAVSYISIDRHHRDRVMRPPIDGWPEMPFGLVAATQINRCKIESKISLHFS